MARLYPRIGELLVELGVITAEQLAEAVRRQAWSGGRLGTNLVELGYIDQQRLAKLLAEQLKIPAVTAAQIDKAPRDAIGLLTTAVASRLRAVPVREDGDRLWVAMIDPTDREAVAELERVTKRAIRPMVTPELLMNYALERHYGVRQVPRVVEVKTSDVELLEVEKPMPSLPGPPVFHDEPVPSELAARVGFLDQVPPPVPVAAPRPPVAPPAGEDGRLSMADIAQQLSRAESDPGVMEVAMKVLAQDVRRLVVMTFGGGRLKGWRGVGVDDRLLQKIEVELAELPLVGQTLASGVTYLGRLTPQLLGPLALVLSSRGESLGVVAPIRLGRRAVGCLIGVEATLDTLRRKPEYDALVSKLDQALHIGYLRRQLLAP